MLVRSEFVFIQYIYIIVRMDRSIDMEDRLLEIVEYMGDFDKKFPIFLVIEAHYGLY